MPERIQIDLARAFSGRLHDVIFCNRVIAYWMELNDGRIAYTSISDLGELLSDDVKYDSLNEMKRELEKKLNSSLGNINRTVYNKLTVFT